MVGHTVGHTVLNLKKNSIASTVAAAHGSVTASVSIHTHTRVCVQRAARHGRTHTHTHTHTHRPNYSNPPAHARRVNQWLFEAQGHQRLIVRILLWRLRPHGAFLVSFPGTADTRKHFLRKYACLTLEINRFLYTGYFSYILHLDIIKSEINFKLKVKMNKILIYGFQWG